MKLEKIKNHKKIIIGGLITVGIITTLILTTSKAKYKNIETLDLVNGIINYTPADIDLVAIQIENEAGEYEDTSAVPTSGYALSDKSYCNVNGEKDTSITLTYESDKIGVSNISKKIKCYLFFDKKVSAVDKVIGDTDIIKDKTDINGLATARDTGIYSASDDYGTSYYFRGIEGNLNNWLEFAGFYWRIIRVNGNGSIRIIYSGIANDKPSKLNKIGDKTHINGEIYPYSLSMGDNSYVGYINSLNGSGNSTSYMEAHSNLYDSSIKKEIDNWYKAYVVDKSLDDYIDLESGFCNDRQIVDTGDSRYGVLGYGKNATVYAPRERINSSPTLKCTNMSRDLFTHTSANIGNKKLQYPIGLITVDELMFAGAYGSGANTTFYLYTNTNY